MNWLKEWERNKIEYKLTNRSYFHIISCRRLFGTTRNNLKNFEVNITKFVGCFFSRVFGGWCSRNLLIFVGYLPTITRKCLWFLLEWGPSNSSSSYIFCMLSSKIGTATLQYTHVHFQPSMFVNLTYKIAELTPWIQDSLSKKEVRLIFLIFGRCCWVGKISGMKFNYKAPPAAIFLVNLVRESDLPAATEMVQQNKVGINNKRKGC